MQKMNMEIPHYASEKGHLNIVSYLIEHNADINATNNDVWTALHYASQKGHLNIVSYLIQHGAKIVSNFLLE